MQLGKYDRTASNEDAFFNTRRDVIRDDIAKRLRNVCSHLSDAEFKRRPYSGVKAYAQSKQADRMLTWALARRLEGTKVTANAVTHSVDCVVRLRA